MATLSDLYGHLKTLVEQWCYNKSQMDTSLNGKVDKETGKGLSTNDYTTAEKNKLSGIEAQANKTVVDSALSSTSTNPLQNKAINTALSNKADSSSVPTKTSDLTNDGSDGTNVFVANNDSRLTDSRTPTSHSHGVITNDGKIGSSANLCFVYTTAGGTISSKEKIGNITAGGKIGSASNRPLITTTAGLIATGSFGTTANSFCEGNDSRLSDARTPTAHTHNDNELNNTQTLSNIIALSSLTNLDQQKHINVAIDEILGILANMSFMVFTDNKGTASADKMGKLYVVNENTKVNFYYVKQTGSGTSATYDWEKMDTDILDELVVNWSDVQNKPSTFTPSSHTHGNLQNDGTLLGYNGAGVVLVNGNNQIYKATGLGTSQLTEANALSYISTSANETQENINDAFDDALSSLDTNKISKSQTAGLVKNDGTIDTTTYLSSLPSHTHGNIANGGTCSTDVTFNSKILVTNSSNKIGTSTAIDVLDSVVQSLIQYGSS